jgi:20S proteasome alpha/beta subunit
MTIAIGLIATNGIVMAADRLETDGYQKNDTGKIGATWKAHPTGSLIITGAGGAIYLDSIMHRLREWFGDDKKNSDPKEIADAINTINHKFYTDAVLPFSAYPDHARPDYSLLIGCDMAGRSPSVFLTERLALNRADDYAAVGTGASTAKTLLSKFYVPLPVESAISLAAFVMYEVKASIEGCGLGTDIFYTWRHVPLLVPNDEVLRMEGAFHQFYRSERENLHFCIGSDIAHSSQSLKEDKSQRHTLRALFIELHDDRLRRMSPPEGSA